MVDRSKYIYPERIEIYSCKGYGSMPPESYEDFIQFFSNRFKLVPEEHKKNVKIEISSEVEYDSSQATIEMYYYRPPTEMEVDKRVADAKSQAEKQLAWARSNLKRLEGLQ